MTPQKLQHKNNKANLYKVKLFLFKAKFNNINKNKMKTMNLKIC